MKNLNLKIASHSNIDAYFLVDGRRIKSKKDDFGNQCKVVETENDEVEIKIFDWNEMQGKLWYLTSFLFFIISIFGLLDIKLNKNCRSIDCKVKVKLGSQDNKLKIIYNKFEDGAEAIKYESDCEVDIISNRYYVNKECKKRFKIMRIVKVITVVLAVVAIILLLK